MKEKVASSDFESPMVDTFLKGLCQVVDRGSRGRFQAEYDSGKTAKYCKIAGPFMAEWIQSVHVLMRREESCIRFDLKCQPRYQGATNSLDLRRLIPPAIDLRDPGLLAKVLRTLHHGFGVALFVERDDQPCAFFLPDQLSE